MHDESGPMGFLGGSFDPVHIGHLRGAMAVREALNLVRVDLVPAAQSPLKPEAMLAGSHRLAMLELAIADVPGLGADALCEGSLIEALAFAGGDFFKSASLIRQRKDLSRFGSSATG